MTNRYTIKAILYSLTPRGSQKKWKNGDQVFYQVSARSFDVRASRRFPEDIYRKHIINTKDNKLWKKALKTMLTDEFFRDKFAREYIDAMYIMNYDIIPTSGKRYRPLEEDLTNQCKLGIYNTYITTAVNLPCETLKEALENKSHRANECWLNAILDNYSHTLLSQKKNNREHILNIINKTEDNIKNGISVNDMMPFFKHYSIPLRVYDCMGEFLVRCDREKRSHFHKAMYCMVKNDHIYVFNNVESLKHKADTPLKEKEISKNYYTRDKLELRQYRMIDGIKDTLDICQNEIGIEKLGDTFYNKDIVKIHTVLRKDNMLDVVWDSIEQGYEPDILDEAGKITRLVIQIVNVAFIIKTQQLRPEIIDGEIVVDNAELYNKMNEAMSEFNFNLFKINHKSYYSSWDILYLNCYKTIVPSGFLQHWCGECSEIDVSKAFTSELANITKIPIFNEFDHWKSWKPCRGYTIDELSLYVVKTNKINLFFNKRYCLVYGKYLKRFLDNVDILYYKEPSFIKDVDYSKTITKLFNTHFTDDVELDKYIKKTISNVNCGLLENSK